MIVIDTSALIALINREPEGPQIIRILAESSALKISAATMVEATAVALRWGEDAAITMLDQIVQEAKVEIIPFNLQQMSIARAAYLKYGKGRGHPAQLNFGDCVSYALARSLDAPLLYKGNGFAHTDVKIALPMGAA